MYTYVQHGRRWQMTAVLHRWQDINMIWRLEIARRKNHTVCRFCEMVTIITSTISNQAWNMLHLNVWGVRSALTSTPRNRMNFFQMFERCEVWTVLKPIPTSLYWPRIQSNYTDTQMYTIFVFTPRIKMFFPPLTHVCIFIATVLWLYV